MKTEKEPMATETDVACMALTIALCDALMDANLLSVEDLQKRLDVVQQAVGKRVVAAGIVATVREAIADPKARAQRKHLLTLLNSNPTGKA